MLARQATADDRDRGGLTVRRRVHLVRRGRRRCRIVAARARACDQAFPEQGAAAFASQNNPLDVTGQAAVETEMFEGALEALANDPVVGLVAFDAFPPRLPDEMPWADSVLAKVVDLQRRTGVAFVSVAMSPLAYGPGSGRVHETLEAAWRSCRGIARPRGRSGRCVDHRSVRLARRRRASATCGARRRPPDAFEGAAGGGRSQGSDRVGTLRRAATRARRPSPHRGPPPRPPPDRVPRRDQGAGAGDPAQGPARRGSPVDRGPPAMPGWPLRKSVRPREPPARRARRSWCNRW